MSSTLRGSARPLAESFDVAMLDLDGVVYVGADAVPGAPDALAATRQLGVRLAFVTNNAARPPQAVAAHLTELGIAAEADEVITSAQAASRYLADRLPAGAKVLVVGTTGLVQALLERGLTPVSDATGVVEAVVQGHSPDTSWRLLAEGAVAINRGVPWVATNVDPTVPSPRGSLPGNGSLVAALRLATRAEPVVTGKPDPTMHRETVLRTGAKRPIVVGDRLDTDIEGANAVGCPSLLVFSGVTTPAELVSAAPALRPTYLAADLRGLLVEHPTPVVHEDGAECRGWRAVRSQGALTLTQVRASVPTSSPVDGSSEGSSGSSGPSAGPTGGTGGEVVSETALDALRAICAAAWDGENTGSAAVEGGAAPARGDASPAREVTAGDAAAGAILRELGFAAG